jgi:hypothetical protein
VCEAAFLCSRVKTTVLTSTSNYGNLKVRCEEMAKKHGGSIEVKKLLIATNHLDTERVKTLMAVAKNSASPLYIQVSGFVPESERLLKVLRYSSRSYATLPSTLAASVVSITTSSGSE